MQYQWKDQPDRSVGSQEAPEQVRKLNDHLVDAMRYVLYSKPIAPEELEAQNTTTFPGQFPPPKIETLDETADKITPIDIPSFYD